MVRTRPKAYPAGAATSSSEQATPVSGRRGSRLHRLEQQRVLRGRDRMPVSDRIFGMRRLTVVALAVVLDRELPIARNRIGLAMGHLGVLELIRCERPGEIVPDRVEGRGIGVEMDEDQADEYPHLQAPEAEL